MKTIRAVACGVVIAAAGLWAGRAFTEDDATPAGPEYDVLRKALGEWSVKGTIDMGTPVPTTAEAQFTMIFGHYLVQNYESTAADFKFQGMGWIAYSPREKKYLTSWYDSMSPVPATYSGAWDEASKTLKSTGTVEGPDGPVPVRSDITFTSDDEFTYTEWAKKGAVEVKVVELAYTRKK